MKTADLPQLRRLSAIEKLELVEDLWNDIAAETADAPLPDWHRRALEEDSALHAKTPHEGSPWPEARARILAQR